MTEAKDAPADPFGGFVVETEIKPDGRLIHYYEWPQPAAKDAADAGDLAIEPRPPFGAGGDV